MLLLRKTKILELTGVSASTIDRLVKDGRFPAPVRIGKRAVAWPEAEVREWIAARAAERDRDNAAG